MSEQNIDFVAKTILFIRLLVVVAVAFPFRIFVRTIGSRIAPAQIAPRAMAHASVFAIIEKLDRDASA